MKKYYEILEVNEKASQEIIEKAYKTLVKKYHPDLYSTVQKKEAELKLKDINEAYNILSDSFLRHQYDLELEKEKLNRANDNYNYYNNGTTYNDNIRNANNANTNTNSVNNGYNNVGDNKNGKKNIINQFFNKNKNMNYQNNIQNQENNVNAGRKKNNVGTIFGIIELMKDLKNNRPPKREKRKLNETDFLAIGLTIVALIIIGVILWFIPFTNGWMRQLLFENPIFNFIGGLFT